MNTTHALPSTPSTEPSSHRRSAADSVQASRWRFGQEIDAWVNEWSHWIGRRRNRAVWASWVAEHPSLARVNPLPGAGERLDVRDDARAIHALMTIGRTNPAAVTALMALLAPMWVHAKRRYLSLESAELASAMLSENLEAPSTQTAPVRAIIRKATRQSDRAYWVPNHDRPASIDMDPNRAASTVCGDDFVDTLITNTVISQHVVEGSCLHLRIQGRTQAEINAQVGSAKRARTRTHRERNRLAAQLGWSTWTSRTGHVHKVAA